MPEKEFNRIIIILLKNTEKQIHELKKFIHDMDQKLLGDGDIEEKIKQKY